MFFQNFGSNQECFSNQGALTVVLRSLQNVCGLAQIAFAQNQVETKTVFCQKFIKLRPLLFKVVIICFRPCCCVKMRQIASRFACGLFQKLCRKSTICQHCCTSVNQGCGVGGKMSDSNYDLSKISDTDCDSCINTVNEVWLSTILQQLAINGIRGTQQEFSVSVSFKRYCTISTGIPNLGVSCKKLFSWTSGVRVGQKIRLHPKTSDSATLVSTFVYVRNSEQITKKIDAA